MNKDTNILIRVNSDLKERANEIAKKYNVSLSELINACLVEFDQRDMVPMNIRKHFPNKYIKQNEVTLALIKLCLKDIINKNAPGKVKRVFLFGSYARGEQTQKSDIDFRFETEDDFSLFNHSNIRLDLKEALHREIDIITAEPEKLDPTFLESIRKDEICIYER